jgi:glycosyltransferase involved in cell wall biosynthesis
MLQSGTYNSYPHKIALIGNYLPRQCGIATFTTDLLKALAEENSAGECWAVVINDVPEGYGYPSEVRFEVNQRVLPEYQLAADFLNMNRVDVVCVQHEFGIFGGENSAHVLELLDNLRMPVVTTLHTVIQAPTTGQKAITKRIAQLSDRLVVMSRRAEQILLEVYGVPVRRITMIHHGIPDVPFVDPNYYKDQYGVEGRKVILTFGLLSPGKGIETMIDALPAVIEQHPEAVYIVLGATHPHVKKEQGEAYRLSLQRRALELGVGAHLIFHNRFVELTELCEYLGVADIYVTPYLNREQIVSGTLAYALGSGKATVSTPYWYAEEMLAEGRGRIVPFQDPRALAEQVNDLFTQEVERHAMRKRAYTFCRDMVWKEVARRYLEVFSEVKRERESSPRPVFWAKAMGAISLEVPQPKLDHIIRLTDDVGILQHAKFIVPNRFHGYCTDDNARALIAVLMAQDVIAESEALTDLACTYISFLHHAFNEENGRFRNFMGYDRRWLEKMGSEDSHGRAIWGLGEAVALAQSNDIRAAAQAVFEKALPALMDFSYPQTLAYALVGIHAYLRRFSGDSEARRVRERLADRLLRKYRKNASDDWPWIEDLVTYGNGKIPQAFILSGRWLYNNEMLQAGLGSLEWLMQIQTDTKGHFVPVGNNGWYPRGGEKARFDQQPIEAQEMIEACHEAYKVTSDTKWLHHARRCLEWFLGHNDLNAPLYDHKTGGCCDGLNANGPNRNQGAESTLSCFLSMLNLNILQSRETSLMAAVETELANQVEATAHGS